MSDKPESQPCPKCGGQIPADAPQGLCPKCLLQQASIHTETGKGASTKPNPPTHEELAAAFPQLDILELIGQGGMGFVFKARQKKIDRVVALKILPQTLAADPAFAERFTREGRVLARLNHPNIVTIHDFGQANGFFYLLMEFVDGVNLREAMKVGRFTTEQALAVVPKICEALQFAHDEGILHRDIKPENILLDSKGRIKIADFGIAKLVGEPHGETNLTVGGAALGTPHYMAPEQLETPGKVDHRADIYSLGVVFYEMLTGELPIGKFQPPSRKVTMDVRLDDVVLHALEKEPERRYQKVSDVKTQVDTITSTPSKAALPPAVPITKPPPKDRFWRRFAIGAALVLLAPILIPAVAILLAILLPAFSRANHKVQGPPTSVVTAETSSEARFVLDTVPPQPGQTNRDNQIRWHFKGLIPPNQLAQVLLVRWTNGVPSIDKGGSAYFKVGDKPADVEFFLSYEKHDAPYSWAAQWNVSLGLPFTTGWGSPVEPPFTKVETPPRMSIRSGHQASVGLLDYIRPSGAENRGPSGVELRIFLEPLKNAPMRVLPEEKDMGTFVGGTGLIGTVDEALRAMQKTPTEPGTLAFDANSIRPVVTLLSIEDHSLPGFVMWKPDGSTVSEPVRSVLTNFWERSSKGLLWYSVLISNAPNESGLEAWSAKVGRNPVNSMAGRIEKSPALGGTLVRFSDFGPAAKTSTNVRFGVPVRPPKTLLVWKGPSFKLAQDYWPGAESIEEIDVEEFASKRILDFDPARGFFDRTNAGSKIRIDLPASRSKLGFWRLEVTDKDGHEHLVRRYQEATTTEGQPTGIFLWEVDVVPADIKAITLKGHFLAEDFDWTSFENVVLRRSAHGGK